jgi:hypothetical protein
VFGVLAYLSLGQGVYYLSTGLWPIVNIRAFEAVTGPKTDHWLVKTVGVLVAVIGAVLVLAAFRNPRHLDIVVLAVASATGLMGIDVWYVVRKVIAPIYLVDAVVELGLVFLWFIAAGGA